MNRYPLIFILIFFACNPTTQKPTPSFEQTDSLKYIIIPDVKTQPHWRSTNTIICQIISEPDNLHPTNGISALRHELNTYLHKTLLTTNYQTLEIQPWLVKELPVTSKNGCEFTFELLPNIYWENGQLLSVDDIIFTAKANACALTLNPNAKPYWEQIQDIKKDSLHTNQFTVVMKQPHIQNLSMWCDYPIIQKQLYDPDNILTKHTFDQLIKATIVDSEINNWAFKFNNIDFHNPVNVKGLGAYKLVEWEPGLRLTLVKKHNTKVLKTLLDSAFADTLQFVVTSDATAQMLEFKAQTFDVSTTLSTKTLLNLQNDSSFNNNYHSAFVSTFNYTYAAFNCKPEKRQYAFFTDKNIRRAVALLTPVDQINKVLNMNKNKRLSTPVSPYKNEYNAALPLLPYDVEKAKSLLIASGWTDSNNDGVRDKLIDGKKVEFSFELIYFTNAPDWKDYAEMMAASYKTAGIEAIPTGYDPATGQQKMFDQDFDMILSSWGGNAGPEDYSQLWSTDAWHQKGANFTGFGSTKTDSLVRDIKQCMDNEKRIELSKQMQAHIYDEQPYVFLFWSMRKIAVHKRLGNVQLYFERPAVLLNQLKPNTK